MLVHGLNILFFFLLLLNMSSPLVALAETLKELKQYQIQMMNETSDMSDEVDELKQQMNEMIEDHEELIQALALDFSLLILQQFRTSLYVFIQDSFFKARSIH